VLKTSAAWFIKLLESVRAFRELACAAAGDDDQAEDEGRPGEKLSRVSLANTAQECQTTGLNWT